MVRNILLITLCCFTLIGHAQSDEELVRKTCMNYIEGFYEGDEDKLKTALKPSLYKIGFWKRDGKYGDADQMTYEEALAYANRVKENKNFAKEGSPKEVKVFEVLDKIASAKVSAWWGYDYILLSKNDGKWMIEEVIWQGPPKK